MTQAVLLVGGEGTRLRPLTVLRPKALVPLLNEPLLSHEFGLLAAHGIRDIILAVGYQADALRDELGDGSRWGVSLTYVQDPEPRGTAGAIRNVAHLLDGPFIAMNGDLVYEVDLTAVIADHEASGAAVTFSLRRVADISRFGLIECDDTGRVTAFREKQAVDETGRNTVNSGLYVMSPEVLDFIPEGRAFSNETELFPSLLEAGRALRGYVPQTQGYWADVGTIPGYLETSRDLLDGAVSWTGPQVPQRLAGHAGPSAPVRLDEDITVGPGCTVGPYVTIGPRTTLGAGCHLSNCILWGDTVVSDGCRLSNTIIAGGVTLPAGTSYDGEVLVP